MNSKILLAFLGGALLASGIVYMAVKPDSEAGDEDHRRLAQSKAGAGLSGGYGCTGNGARTEVARCVGSDQAGTAARKNA